MKCPSCQHENPDSAKFCGGCGGKLSLICPQCGFENDPVNRFCNECGQNLTQPSEPAPKELSFDEKIEKIQKYLPGGLTEKILSQRGKIEGEHRQVTVMFADMAEFTPLVEKLGPEKAYSVMDDVYEILIHKVHDFEGTVNEMTGDGVVALFGAPIAVENAPQRAIQSALSIHRELARLNDQKKSEGLDTPIKMRIGIHTGPVVVGTLGNDLRVEFKAVGDTVILASRLEGMAESGTTYITEDTFKLTEGLYRFEALGEKEIKGKEEPVRVYRVIAPSTLSTRFEVNAERGLTPFVGRDRELELLLDGFERVKSGHGQAFSIVAEAGVGKTRLLYELRKAVASEDVIIREGQCLSFSQSEAYRPISEILKTNFNILEGDEDFVIKEKVRRGLQTIQADEASTLPYLLELFSVEESGVNKALSADERKYQFMEALKRVALKGSDIRPVILVIEDLHWIDEGSEEALKGLFERIPGTRILLIFTYRPEFLHTWGTKTYHNQLMLNRLSNRESLNMVTHLLGTNEVDPALEELILEKTEGVPFFIEELIKSLKDLKIIEKKDDRYDLSKDAKELAIPSTIQDVILARVDPLPEGVKEVLQTGSAIEREFSYELIQRATGLPERELLSNLSILKDAELVYERGVYPESSYIFKHALTRQVVYDSILSNKREALHGKIGQAIEALYPARLDEYYEALAYHFAESKNHEKAYRYLKLSADKALDIYAYKEAVRLFERALQTLEILDPEDKARRCDLLIALGDALIGAGDPRRVLDVEAPAALAIAEDINDKIRASRVCQRAVLALTFYSLDPGITGAEMGIWAEQADRYAKPGTIERAWADTGMGTIERNKGHFKEVVSLYNNALALARQLGDPDTLWIVVPRWIMHMAAPKRFEERLRLAEEMMTRSRIGISNGILGIALWEIGHVFLVGGDRDRFEQAWQEWRDLAERIGTPHNQLFIIYQDNLQAVLDGRLEDAVELNRRLWNLGNELDLAEFVNVLIGTTNLRPRLYLGRAKNMLLALLENPGTSKGAKALCLTHLERKAEAIEMVEQVIQARFDTGTDEDETAAWEDVTLLEAAVLVKHREATYFLLRRLAESGDRTTGRLYTTCISRHLGAAATMLDKMDEGRAHYHDALKVATDMRFRPEIALTRFQLAELLFDHYPDERDQAAEHLDVAISEFEEMKMQPSLEKAIALKDKIGA